MQVSVDELLKPDTEQSNFQQGERKSKFFNKNKKRKNWINISTIPFNSLFNCS